MITKRRFIVITGEGKGKTTAALGLMLRAWGHDLRIAIVHFVKSRLDVGEVKAIQKINNLLQLDTKQSINSIDQFIMGRGFLPATHSSRFSEHLEQAKHALEQSKKVIDSKKYQMIILDEICWAIHRKLISEDQALTLVKIKHNAHLVFTGRYATPGVISLADTVSEIHNIKHAYHDSKLPAQIGIEK